MFFKVFFQKHFQKAMPKHYLNIENKLCATRTFNMENKQQPQTMQVKSQADTD